MRSRTPTALPPPPPNRTLAWWALGLASGGFLCCLGSVVAWVVSFKAIDRSEDETDPTGRQVATISLGLAAATLGISLVGIASLFAFDFFGIENSRAVGTARNADPDVVGIGELGTGVCISDRGLRGGRPHLRRTPCLSAHDAEVIAVIDVDGERFPGRASVDRQAAGCDAALRDVVGHRPPPTELELRYYYPTARTWPDPRNRVIVCIVLDPKGPMSEPLRELLR